MPPKDKVLTLAFMVPSAFAVGDYLAFTATFQPNMIVTMVVGKLGGGLIAVLFALWLAMPHARRLEQADLAAEKFEVPPAPTPALVGEG